jgi:hypothetical protein
MYQLAQYSRLMAIRRPFDSVTTDAAIKLLIHANSGIIDYSQLQRTLTAVGNAQISTAQKKFGSGSILFDGAGDTVTIPTSTDFDFASGTAFTIDCWFRIPSTSGQQTLFCLGADPNPLRFTVRLGQLWFGPDGGEVITGSTSISVDTWHHAAVCRSGSSTKAFLNGTQEGSTYSDTNNYTSSAPTIGDTPGKSHFFNGYI